MRRYGRDNFGNLLCRDFITMVFGDGFDIRAGPCLDDDWFFFEIVGNDCLFVVSINIDKFSHDFIFEVVGNDCLFVMVINIDKFSHDFILSFNRTPYGVRIFVVIVCVRRRICFCLSGFPNRYLSSYVL